MTPPPDSDRRAVNLPKRESNLPFSDAVRIGDTLYISGRIGIDPATGMAPAEVEKELDLLFSGFSAVLEQGGMTWDDLVWVQIFSTDLTLWDRFNATYVKHFHRDFPARAFLGSGSLVRNARFEMMGIAIRRNS